MAAARHGAEQQSPAADTVAQPLLRPSLPAPAGCTPSAASATSEASSRTAAAAPRSRMAAAAAWRRRRQQPQLAWRPRPSGCAPPHFCWRSVSMAGTRSRDHRRSRKLSSRSRQGVALGDNERPISSGCTIVEVSTSAGSRRGSNKSAHARGAAATRLPLGRHMVRTRWHILRGTMALIWRTDQKPAR